MRSIFCIIFAYYLFKMAVRIKPANPYEIRKTDTIAGILVIASWITAGAGLVLMIFGL